MKDHSRKLFNAERKKKKAAYQRFFHGSQNENTEVNKNQPKTTETAENSDVGNVETESKVEVPEVISSSSSVSPSIVSSPNDSAVVDSKTVKDESSLAGNSSAESPKSSET